MDYADEMERCIARQDSVLNGDASTNSLPFILGKIDETTESVITVEAAIDEVETALRYFAMSQGVGAADVRKSYADALVSANERLEEVVEKQELKDMMQLLRGLRKERAEHRAERDRWQSELEVAKRRLYAMEMRLYGLGGIAQFAAAKLRHHDDK